MSRNVRINSSSALSGGLRVPGDKSISHRIAMLAAIAEGASTITNFASSADCHATLDCIERLGIRIDRRPDDITIHGKGLQGFDPPLHPAKLYVGNSGSTIRMISGILAGQSFTSEVDGDESIRRRPMKRIIEPLRMMGAQIDGRNENFAPLTIRGGNLRAIRYESLVASAQVKSCMLFAGLYADGTPIVKEPAPSRNHSELM
jgi:3-phosphoshikimate 1-carboxyvinyltransferase